MHRILSYQTAMRQSDEVNVRDYITKRICVSVVFSVGFFTLICGFLLGKFVTDREYKIKEIQNADRIQVIRELQIIQKTLIITSQNITSQDIRNTHEDFNKKVWDQLNSCTQEKIPNLNERFDIFVDKFVDHSVHQLIKCLLSLDNFIRTFRNSS